jgi:hypothetical protein
MSTNKKYHKEVFMPKAVHQFCPVGDIRVEYSKHAINAAETDRYGQILLPFNLKLEKSQIIEVELENNRVTKVLYRLPYTSRFDLMVALIPSTFLVKTVWLNDRTDKHFTLDKSEYDRI